MTSSSHRIESKASRKRQPDIKPGQLFINFPVKKAKPAQESSAVSLTEKPSVQTSEPTSEPTKPTKPTETPVEPTETPVGPTPPRVPTNPSVPTNISVSTTPDVSTPDVSTPDVPTNPTNPIVPDWDVCVSDAELSEDDQSILTTLRTQMTSDLLDKVMAKFLAERVGVKVFKSTYAYTLATLGGTQVAEQIGADPKGLYLFPMCDNTHWVLIAFIGLGTATAKALVLNSLAGNELGGLVTGFVDKVSEAYATSIEIVRPRLPQQAADSNDCGFFVAYFARELMNCVVDGVQLDLFWKSMALTVVDARAIVGSLLGCSDFVPRIRKKYSPETGERAESLQMVRRRAANPIQDEPFFDLDTPWDEVTDQFGTVSKPDVPDIQMSSWYFEASSLDEVTKAVWYVVYSLSSRKTLTNGMDLACLGPLPNHATPRWVSKRGPHHIVRYILNGEDWERKLLHLIAKPNSRMDEERIQISHRCHRFWCYNGLHVTLESEDENIRRNSCGQRSECDHDPLCVVDGADYFNAKWDLTQTRAQALARLAPLEVFDEVFEPCCPPPIDLQAESYVLREDKVAVIKYALYLLCPRGAEIDALGRKLDCWMPPSTEGAPKWLTTDGQHPTAQYLDKEKEWLTKLLFFGTPEFEHRETLQVSHLCHHSRCHNPEHICLESNALNKARNNCAPEVCEHTPQCMVMGSDFFRASQRLKKYGIVYEGKPFKCPDCDNVYPNVSTFAVHYLTHGKPTYECPKCPARFAQRRVLEAHVVRHLPEKPFMCPVCDDCFKDSSTLGAHIKNKHKGFSWLVCPYKECQKTYKKKEFYERHVKMHEGSRPEFECDTCGREFASKQNLLNHARMHERVTCSVVDCGREVLAVDLNSHMKVHTKGFLECKECGRGLCNEESLQKHLKNHTNPGGYKCGIDGCKETFSSYNLLWKHKQRVHFHVTFRCEKCGKNLKSKDSLKYHVEHNVCDPNAQNVCDENDVVHGELTCDVCNRKLTSRTFESHMMFHENEGWLECDQCGAGSRNRQGLNRHLKIHGDPKRHKCKVKGCDAAFGSDGPLRKHEREVHEKNMVECPQCGRAFLTSADLGKHECRGYAEEVAGRKPGRKVHYAVFCEKCDREVLAKDLEAHMTVHTLGYRQCEVCGIGLKNKDTYSGHIQKHATSLDYVCKVEGCGMAFKSSRDRGKHQQAVHKELRVECNKCGRSFMDPADLANHGCRKDEID